MIWIFYCSFPGNDLKQDIHVKNGIEKLTYNDSQIQMIFLKRVKFRNKLNLESVDCF